MPATMAHRRRDSGLACSTSMRVVGLVNVFGRIAAAVVLARICS
ncbi:hypothetical protein ACFTZK_08760 [Streptomyces decoyicus]